MTTTSDIATVDPTALFTDRPTVILNKGARHIDGGDLTLCGWYPITSQDVRFSANIGQRISCAACRAAQ
jgi:hypothetical protein